MKTTNFISKNFNSNEDGVEVGVVSGLKSNHHTHEYQVFDLKKPVKGVGLIGVKDHDVFALQFKANFEEDYAYAIYLDGINVIQQYGIQDLSSIAESKRDDYHFHAKFISRDHNGSTRYIDRFSQANSENRYFTFTMGENTGINELLIADPSSEHRIEIYLWKEESIEQIIESWKTIPLFNIMSIPDSDSKIGAGESSYEEYKTASTNLKNPEFIGKALFIHLPAEKLNHLGETLIPINSSNNFQFSDPMDLVPKT